MSGMQNLLIRCLVVLFVCGSLGLYSAPPAAAQDKKKCQRAVNQSIKLLKKGEILNFNGKKMLKALKSYQDGIDKKEAKKFDKVMGPFDDNFKVMKKLYKTLQDVKEQCE